MNNIFKYDKKEIEHLKVVYDYTQKNLNDLIERKRHIEIKILYLLQAGALVITLFTALLGIVINPNFIYIKFSKVFVILFYIFIALSILCLLLSLNDNLAVWKFTKFISKKRFDLDIDEQLEGLYKEEDRDKLGQYLEEPTPTTLLNLNPYKTASFYNRTIEAIIKSIKTTNIILLCKNMYFTYALRLFVFSLMVVIVLGIFVA